MTSKRNITPKVVLPLIAGTALFAASTTIIGMASSQNSSTLTLDNSRVSGNATLFDGSKVEASGFSRLKLNNGTRMDLGAGSEAKVYANHASLEKGMSEIQSGSGFEIDANTLKIRTAGSDAIARVKLDNKSVMVTALNAPVEVLNPAGMLIARVTPGLPLSFMPQGGSGSDMTGCLVNKKGVLILVSDPGNQQYQITNLSLSTAKKLVGNKVTISGTSDSSAPAGGATGVVKATSASLKSKGGCESVASTVGATATAAGLAVGAGILATGGAAVAAGTAVAAGAAAGIGISTTALVVGGVAAATAAAVGGAAAAGSFSSSPE